MTSQCGWKRTNSFQQLVRTRNRGTNDAMTTAINCMPPSPWPRWGRGGISRSSPNKNAICPESLPRSDDLQQLQLLQGASSRSSRVRLLSAAEKEYSYSPLLPPLLIPSSSSSSQGGNSPYVKWRLFKTHVYSATATPYDSTTAQKFLVKK